MKRFFSYPCLLILLTSCGLFDSGDSVVIDWVDFINWNGKQYVSIDEGVIADPSHIGERIGEVQFHVYENVSNPSYQPEDGDAAFHEAGTDIYAVKGRDLLAVQEQEEINGYRLYYPVKEQEYEWRFEDVTSEKVNLIEVYRYSETPAANPDKVAEWTDSEVQQLLEILEDGKRAEEDFVPAMDPHYYAIVLYTGNLVAYQYTISYDGETYFWHPGDTEILSNKVGEFLPQFETEANS